MAKAAPKIRLSLFRILFQDPLEFVERLSIVARAGQGGGGGQPGGGVWLAGFPVHGRPLMRSVFCLVKSLRDTKG
jgi:hypothetical protein